MFIILVEGIVYTPIRIAIKWINEKKRSHYNGWVLQRT